jgi:hypothetical protein
VFSDNPRGLFPSSRFEPSEKKDIRRYEGQIEGITRTHVLAFIYAYQPWAGQIHRKCRSRCGDMLEA